MPILTTPLRVIRIHDFDETAGTYHGTLMAIPAGERVVLDLSQAPVKNMVRLRWDEHEYAAFECDLLAAMGMELPAAS